MVGIVIVSHSQKIAEGAKELALQMAPEAPIAAAGGLPDGGIGTDFQRIYDAIESVAGADGVIVLFDMGSAIMTTEMVIDSFDGVDIRMVDGPVVESSVVAAVSSGVGMDMDGIVEAIRDAAQTPKLSS